MVCCCCIGNEVCRHSFSGEAAAHGSSADLLHIQWDTLGIIASLIGGRARGYLHSTCSSMALFGLYPSYLVGPSYWSEPVRFPLGPAHAGTLSGHWLQGRIAEAVLAEATRIGVQSVRLFDSDVKLLAQLNSEQLSAVGVITEQLLRVVAWRAGRGPQPHQLLIIISGTAGTGKSHVIKVVRALSQCIFNSLHAALVVSPSAWSAALIGGTTIHAAACVPVNYSHSGATLPNPLDVPDIRKRLLFDTFKDVEILMADNFSMIWPGLLGWLDHGCRVGRLSAHNGSEPFGGLPVVALFGDPAQLPPVIGQPLWFGTQSGNLGVGATLRGHSLYMRFDRCIILHPLVLHSSAPCFDCPSSIHPPGALCTMFGDFLGRLRYGSSTPSDHGWLGQRCCTPPTVSNAGNTLHVFPDNNSVLQFNDAAVLRLFHLGALSCSVSSVVTNACHHEPRYRRFSDLCSLPEYARISSEIFFAVGSPVFLTVDLYIPWGLRRLSVGLIVDICFPGGDRSGNPDMILVEFPGYHTGPQCIPGRSIVPISLATRCQACALFRHMHDSHGHCGCGRVGFPLRLCFAINIHQFVGMTIGPDQFFSRVVIDVGPRSVEKWVPGSAYLALSRASRASSMSIASAPSLSRLNYRRAGQWTAGIRIEEERLLALAAVSSQLFHMSPREVYRAIVIPALRRGNSGTRLYARIVHNWVEGGSSDQDPYFLSLLQSFSDMHPS